MMLAGRHRVLVAAKAAPVAHERVDGAVVARLNGSTGSVAGDVAGRFEVTVVASAATAEDAELADLHPQGLDVRTAAGREVRLRLVRHAPETLSPDRYGRVTELLWHSMHELWDGPDEPTFDAHTRTAWSALHALDDDIATALLQGADGAGAAYLVQDYQLCLVPRRLREQDPSARVLYFHHIAWPSPDALTMLPADIVADIMSGILAADAVAFFASRWQRNFLRCAADLVPGAEVDFEASTVSVGGHTVRIAVQPLSYSPGALEGLDHRLPADVAAWAGEDPLVVHAGRTDPIKNADRAVAAFELAAADGGPAAGARLLVRLQPHRLGIAANQAYLDRVAVAVAAANAGFGTERVRLLVGDDRQLTFGCLARADVVVVNSIADGQNLTAFECSAVGEREPVLVLSPRCGAAEVLGPAALTANPFDLVESADAINAALGLPGEERRARAERLRALGRDHVLPLWASRQLSLLDHVPAAPGAGR